MAAVSFHFLEMPIRSGAAPGLAWLGGTPLAVGATAVLVVGSTAGATAAVNQAPSAFAASSPIIPQGENPGTAAAVPSVPAGTGGPIRVLLVGDSEASFLGFGLVPNPATYNVDYAGDGVFGCGLQTYPTSFHGTVVNGNVGYTRRPQRGAV